MTHAEKSALIEHNIKLARYAVKRYGSIVSYLEHDDTFAEALAVLVSAANQFDPCKGKFSTFYLQCAHNRFVLLRKQYYALKNKPPSGTISIDKYSQESDESPANLEISDSMDLAAAVERKIIAQALLSTLTAKQRQIVILVYYYGMTQPDAAKAMGISQQAVSAACIASTNKMRHAANMAQ